MIGPVLLSPEDRALKRAFRTAVKAAGGQVFVGEEIGKAQSRISDYGNPNHPDMPPVDVVRDVEALSATSPGHPHVTRALARQAGGHFTANAVQAAPDPARLSEWLALVTRENADVVVALADENLDTACSQLSTNARARLALEAEQLMAVLRRLLATLDGCGDGTSSVVPIGEERRRGNDTS